ncbi:MAG: DUF6062 family protein [Candidatus Bathyarchaeia archaeon]
MDIAYLRIKRAIECKEECFLCVLEDEIERKFVDTYLSELVMDASARNKIIESRGFCNNHFYKMLIAANKHRSPDGHGIALIANSVVEQLLLDVCKLSRYKNAFRNMLSSEEKCPACSHLAAFTYMYIQKVVELFSLQDEEFMKLFKESRGLCIPHFAALTRTIEEKLAGQAQNVIKVIIEVEEKNQTIKFRTCRVYKKTKLRVFRRRAQGCGRCCMEKRWKTCWETWIKTYWRANQW